MKKTKLLIACMTVAALFTAGCGSSDKGKDESGVNVEVNESEKDTQASEEKNTEDNQATDTEQMTEEVTQEQNQGNTVGDTGLTPEEWCAQAQSIYENASWVYFRFADCPTGFDCDGEDIVDGMWIRVNDFESMEGVKAEYYSYFAMQGHENDLDNTFREIDGKVYCLFAGRGTDITYLNSEVTELTSSTDDTLTFKVVSHYEDHDTEDVFTLIYDRGVWRAGELKLPY